jgi:polyisoprenoid-binding protein YceI
MFKKITGAVAFSLALTAGAAQADTHGGEYVFDSEGRHQFILFKISHLGYSWLYGRFNEFEGSFSFDADNPESSEVSVTVQTDSVDTNHAERDKHIRGEDFLDVEEYPKATFESTRVEVTGDETAKVYGNLTLHGVTREVTLDMEQIGYGDDPWGGYRMGFAGSTEIALDDFNIDYDLGPAAETLELILSVEGVRQ